MPASKIFHADKGHVRTDNLTLAALAWRLIKVLALMTTNCLNKGGAKLNKTVYLVYKQIR